jgi:NADH dehydrogenase (ubiquinone) Fe-S protein 3
MLQPQLLKKLIPFSAYTRTPQEENIISLPHNVTNSVLHFFANHIGTQFKLCTAISGVDIYNASHGQRFAIVYELLSLTFNTRLRIKTFVDALTAPQSAVNVYINANWWEREIWDCFGVYFLKHPDLRRILTDYGFEGYPLRKDFPLYGFVELRYDEATKSIAVEPIEFAQENRNFKI